MYKIDNADLLKKITESGRTFKARAVFKDFTFSDEIKDFNLNMGDTEIKIGNAYSADLEITLFGIFENLKNKMFKLELGFLYNGVYEYIPVGDFFVKVGLLKSDITTIQASDKMYLLEKTYTPTTAFPAMVKTVVEEILDFIGAELATEIPIDRFVLYTPIQYSMREVLGICGSILGKNAYFNRFGKFEYRWYTDVDIEITDEQIKDPLIYDSDFIVEYLEVENNNEFITKGNADSEMGIIIKNDFMIEEYVEYAFTQIQNFSYRPAELPFIIGNPLFDPWDVIKYKKWKIPVMKNEIKFDGGYWGDISTYVQDTLKGYLSPREREEERQNETQKNDRIILENFNPDLVTIAKSTELFTIDFTTAEQNLPVFECTSQINIDKTGIGNTFIVIFDVLVDGVLFFSYMNSVNFGYHVINFIIPLKKLHQGGHSLRIVVYEKEGTEAGHIQAGHSKGLIWGDGLLGISQWDGIINIAEVLSITNTKNIINMITQATADTQYPIIPQATNILSITNKKSKIELTENITFSEV